MHSNVYRSIDEVGAERIAGLKGSPVDFSFGLLRALERSQWGDIRAQYVAVEEGGTLLGLVPVSVGTNVAFTAAMPRAIQAAYPALIDKLGLAAAYKVMVVGTLIADRGYVPLHPECDVDRVMALMLREIDGLARQEKVRVCFVKDLNCDFPGRKAVRAAGFTECYSLPAVRVDTTFASTDEYIQSLTPNGRSHARRTLKKNGKNFTLRVLSDYEAILPDVYPLFRATYLKAEFKLEELPPSFFVECSRGLQSRSEMLICEKGSRIVGAYLALFDAEQQINKRVGLDYSDPESGVIYNFLNYQCLVRAVERGIPLSYLGQTTHTPKIRMGGRLEDQFLYIKGYDPGVRLSLPVQKAWMRRYRAERAYQEMNAKNDAEADSRPSKEATGAGGDHDAGASGKPPWGVFAIASVGVLMVSLDTTIVNVAFPAILSTFPGSTPADLSWVLNIYFVVFAALLVAAGRLADVVGRRRIFLTGLSIFTLASVLCGLAPSALLLVAARALQAVGAAALIPASLAVLLSAFPVSKRITVVGMWGAVAAIGSALGPLLGSALIEWASWRWAFLVNLPVGVIGSWQGLRLIRESRDPDARRPDLLGAAMAVAGVGLLALWIIQGVDLPFLSPRRLASLVGAVGLLVLLVLRCARHPTPVLDLSLFRIRSFTIGNLGTLLFSAAFFAGMIGFVLFLTSVWHYDPLLAGLALTPTPLAAAAAAMPGSRLADRFGHRMAVIPGTLAFAVGGAFLVLYARAEPAYLATWLPGALLMGAGVGLAFPTLASAAAADLPAPRFAVGSAITVTSRQLGGVLGVGGFMVLLSGDSRHLSSYAAFRAGWMFIALLSLIAGAVSLALIPEGRRAKASKVAPGGT